MTIYSDAHPLLLFYRSIAYLMTDKEKKFYTVAAKMRSHMPLQLHKSECITILKLLQVVVTWQSHALTADFLCNSQTQVWQWWQNTLKNNKKFYIINNNKHDKTKYNIHV